MCIGKLFSLFHIQNISCGYSKEPSQWDDSFEHPKHMLKFMGKKKCLQFYAEKFCLSKPVYKCFTVPLYSIQGNSLTSNHPLWHPGHCHLSNRIVSCQSIKIDEVSYCCYYFTWTVKPCYIAIIEKWEFWQYNEFEDRSRFEILSGTCWKSRTCICYLKKKNNNKKTISKYTFR